MSYWNYFTCFLVIISVYHVVIHHTRLYEIYLLCWGNSPPHNNLIINRFLNTKAVENHTQVISKPVQYLHSDHGKCILQVPNCKTILFDHIKDCRWKNRQFCATDHCSCCTGIYKDSHMLKPIHSMMWKMLSLLPMGSVNVGHAILKLLLTLGLKKIVSRVGGMP